MENYIERIAPDGRRVHFKPGTSVERQEKFLASYGRDSGERAASQDQPLSKLMEMSHSGGQPNVAQPQAAPPQPQMQQAMPPQNQNGGYATGYAEKGHAFQDEPEHAKYIGREGLPPKGKGLNPLDFAESPEQYGHNEAERAGASRIGPELMASMMLGPAWKGAGIASRALAHGVTQAGVSAAFNPEKALEHGGKSGAITAGLHPLTELLASTNSKARMVKKAILPLLTGGSAGWAANQAELPVPLQFLAGLLGAFGGHKAGAWLGGKGHYARAAGQNISERTTPEAVRNLQTAQKYGQHLTPAEASGNVALESLEKSLGKTSEGAEHLQQFQKARTAAQQREIDKFSNQIYNPEKDEGKLAQLYKESAETQIPGSELGQVFEKPRIRVSGKDNTYTKPRYSVKEGAQLEKPKYAASVDEATGKTRLRQISEGVQGKPIVRKTADASVSNNLKSVKKSFDDAFKRRIASDPNVDKSIEKVMGDSTWAKEFKGIPEKDLYKHPKFLQAIKEELDTAAETMLASPGQAKKAQSFIDSKNEFLKEADRLIPSYPKAREIYEKKKLVDTIQDLTRKGQDPGQSFSKYFSDKDKLQDAMLHLRSVKGGAKTLTDLNNIFSKQKNIDIAALAKSLPQDMVHTWHGSAYDLAKSLMKSMTGGKYDTATVKLITSKDWPKQSAELAKITNKERRTAKFFEILTKSLSKAR